MGIEVRTISNPGHKTESQVADHCAAWLMNDHGFAIKRNGYEGGNYTLVVGKPGVLRHVVGLVFEYKLMFSTTSSHLVATIDDGDLRKQLAALGFAWFIAWPMLIPAGYGMIASGQFRREILSKIELFVS